MADMSGYPDERVQETLCRYNIARLCRCSVIGFRIFRQDCLEYGPATYNPPNNGPAKVVICIDIIEKYPQDEFDWVVLHECGHLHYRHPWHDYGRTKNEYELCADYWACKQQNRTKYGIKALLRLCNGDTSRVSHPEIDDDLRRGWRIIQPPLTYNDRINALEKSDLPN